MVKHPDPDEVAGDFLSLKDGEIADFTIAEPTARVEWRHWTKDGPTECKGERCGLCYEGKPKQGRFVIQVDTLDGRKTWPLGKRLWQSVLDQAGWPESLEGTTWTLQRTGEERATKWTLQLVTAPTPVTEDNIPALKAKVQELAGVIGLTPQEAIAAAKLAYDKIWPGLPLFSQLGKVIEFLQVQLPANVPAPQPAPSPKQDIEDLFGPEAPPEPKPTPKRKKAEA